MAGPMRRPNHPNPHSPGDNRPTGADGGPGVQGESTPRIRRPSLEMQNEQAPLQQNSLVDPDLFGSGDAPEPALGLSERVQARAQVSMGQNLSPRGEDRDPSGKAYQHPHVQDEGKISEKKSKKRISLTFIFMIFLLVGALAFGLGASVTYYILNGDLDMNSSAVKEAFAALKNVFKYWRSSP
jgi:hypothetical protein